MTKVILFFFLSPGGGSTLKLHSPKAPPVPDDFILVKVGPPGFCNVVKVPRSAVPPPPVPTDEAVFAKIRSDDALRAEQLRMRSSTASGEPELSDQFLPLTIEPEEELTQ